MINLTNTYKPRQTTLHNGLHNTFFQPKLTINNPNDKYEQEADAMADKVMRMETASLQKKEINSSFFKASPISITPIQRKCAHCEEEEKMQRKEMNTGETTADNNLENYIGSLSSSGEPLPDEVRNFYEPRFGYDFSNVKIYTGDVAAKSAQSINALAYTSGNNIVFNNGQYSPGTDSGKKLLGHELTHVVQQRATAQPTIQRRTDSFGKECPDTVKILGKKAIPPFNKEMFDKGYRTYFGLVTNMQVGPKDKYESCITEVLKVEENTCGDKGNMADYDPCSPKKYCMKVNEACGGDSLTDTKFSCSETTFVDLHSTHQLVSLLDGTGKKACKVKCLQRYGCGGEEIGRFYITRNFKLGTYKDGTKKIPITEGTIEKEPAKK